MQKKYKGRFRPHWIECGDRVTSVRIEPEFLFWARQIAAESGYTFKAFIGVIDKARDPATSLSSAIRCYIAQYLHDNPLAALGISENTVYRDLKYCKQEVEAGRRQRC
jgi:predicted DNA-binding ribbon-helix-helix protein